MLQGTRPTAEVFTMGRGRSPIQREKCKHNAKATQQKTHTNHFIAMLSITGKMIVSRYIAESKTTDAGRFGHIGHCQSLYAVDKGLFGQNILHQFLLILLRICSQSVCPISLAMSATELKDHQRTNNGIEEETTVVHTQTGTAY